MEISHGRGTVSARTGCWAARFPSQMVRACVLLRRLRRTGKARLADAQRGDGPHKRPQNTTISCRDIVIFWSQTIYGITDVNCSFSPTLFERPRAQECRWEGRGSCECLCSLSTGPRLARTLRKAGLAHGLSWPCPPQCCCEPSPKSSPNFCTVNALPYKQSSHTAALTHQVCTRLRYQLSSPSQTLHFTHHHLFTRFNRFSARLLPRMPSSCLHFPDFTSSISPSTSSSRLARPPRLARKPY
jgi:hypothetical protein